MVYGLMYFSFTSTPLSVRMLFRLLYIFLAWPLSISWMMARRLWAIQLLKLESTIMRSLGRDVFHSPTSGSRILSQRGLAHALGLRDQQDRIAHANVRVRDQGGDPAHQLMALALEWDQVLHELCEGRWITHDWDHIAWPVGVDQPPVADVDHAGRLSWLVAHSIALGRRQLIEQGCCVLDV